MHRNIEISQFRQTSSNFCYIRPTVSVEKSQFKIVLEMEDVEGGEGLGMGMGEVSLQDKESVLEEGRDNRTTRKIARKQYKIISDNLYSTSQILELYKICGRFNIKQKLQFDSNNLGILYKNLQNFLD